MLLMPIVTSTLALPGLFGSTLIVPETSVKTPCDVREQVADL